MVVNVTKAGKLNNTVFANSTENKTVVNKTSDNITVNPQTGLVISKVANVTEAVVGDLIKYTITVRNSGLSDATGVTVWDVLPGIVKYVEGGSYDSATRNVTWTIDKIEAGKSVEVYVIVNATAAGNLTNIAFANSNENKTVVNKTSDNVTVNPDVKLNITKELVTTGDIYAGDNITYVIVVTNKGLSEATNVKVTDTVKGSGIIISCVDQTGKAYSGSVWTIPSIAAGKNVTLFVGLFLVLLLVRMLLYL